MDQNHPVPRGTGKMGWPDGDDDVINKYGTYEVQRTCGVENDFPQIAQGMPRREADRMREKARQWREKKPE